MKKFILFYLILMIFSLCGYAQIAYYDAVTLEKYVNTASNPPNFKSDSASYATVLGIIKKYIPNLSVTTINDNVKSAITTNSPNNIDYNPILAPFFAGTFQNSTNVTTASSIISSVGNTNVSTLAGGITTFLIKRAKEELLISVIDKLKDPMKFPELPKLFPNTMKLLNSFNSWEYSNVLNTLKEAFDKDLQQLLGDIPNLNTLKPDDYKANPSVYKRVCAITEFFLTPAARVYLSAMKVGNGVITGQKMPDIIHIIAANGYLSDIPGADPNVHNAIRLLDIISYSLRSNVSGQNYISTADFKSLLNDQILSKLYFGLLYQQIKNEQIQFAGAKPIIIADIIAKDYTGATAYINGLIDQGDALNSAFKNLSDAKKKGDKDLTTYWSAILESANQFLQSSMNISLIDPSSLASFKIPDQLQKAMDYATQALGIANDIVIRNYSAAVVDFSNFFPFDPKHPEFKGYFIKYGSFVANLVQAKTGDDAENAIEAVALPVGSYSIKQNATTNISVNGYIGYGIDGNYAKGIYAPIGFSLSTDDLFGAFDKHIVPITLFVPIFDVGSIAQYQLNNPTTTGTSTTGTATGTSTTASTINTSSSNQQIKLGSIFAPGAELFFEIPKWPFAFGTGMRRTPTLSYSSGSTYTTVGARWQWNFTILIDVPIFTLLNRNMN